MKATYLAIVTAIVGAMGWFLVEQSEPQLSNAGQPNAPPPSQETAPSRAGLVALYDFSTSSGTIVKDRSGVGEALDLRIANPKAVRRSEGALEVHSSTSIRSDQAASKIVNAVKRSNALTIEAWVRPARTNQTGPARIVTLSKSPNERNFTLGHDGDRYDVRLRTTKTSTNGIPSINSARKSLTAKPTHVVYTREESGRATIYVNGKQSYQGRIVGNTSNWDVSMRLALANEQSGDRPWLGTYHLVAIYSRALTKADVERNYKAGARAQSELARQEERKRTLSARLFKSRIAPMFARRCIDCHGGKSTRGRLDLSRKFAATRGGKSGRVIVPGDAAASELWKLVKSNDMPKDRTPLSAAEKKIVQQWIDTGAIWSMDAINPAAYVRDRGDGTNWLGRLTVREYVETVRVAVGVDVAEDARKILPPDLRADGFSNTAYNLNVDLGHVEAYAKLAELIVQRMDARKFASQYVKSQKIDDANLRKLIAGMGKWVLRGPLSDNEVTTFLGIAKAVAKEGGDFKETVGYVLEAMLQSPRFIYRIEKQVGDGKPRRVGDYELASRMSYVMWGAPPDKELMRAADAGDLSDRIKVEAQVRRMLNDPRTIERSAQFVYEWLNLGRLDNLRPNPARFPKWDSRLAADMRDETLAFFKEIAWKQKRPLADLLNAQVTFATPRLAAHYGLKPKGKAVERYDVSSVRGRGGLLTQGSVLTIGGDEASMVTRGLFVLHDVLEGKVNDPPPCVDTTPVPTKPGLSQRGVALSRIANKSCGGCHSKFEPLAFGLEKFDGRGAYHDVDEHGNKLRDDGEILFPGSEKPVSYKSSAELMNLLAASDRVQMTITRKVTQWAIGRPLVEADAPILEKIYAEAKKSGGTYSSLITAIVMSDLVQMTRTESK